MEKQLKQFFEFLEFGKKLSNNTLQSYKRDLKQFEAFINENKKNYNKLKQEDIREYIKYLHENGKKASTISRGIASIRSFYQYELKNRKDSIIMLVKRLDKKDVEVSNCKNIT